MPGVAECRSRKCSELGEEPDPARPGKNRQVCMKAGGRIPGNVRCPLEMDRWNGEDEPEDNTPLILVDENGNEVE